MLDKEGHFGFVVCTFKINLTIDLLALLINYLLFAFPVTTLLYMLDNTYEAYMLFLDPLSDQSELVKIYGRR